METITVVGGGLAGLIAATEAAEAGAPVRVLEARSQLGGRARSTPGPYIANLGPHALYTPTELWSWLKRRGLHRPARVPKSPRIVFRWNGEVRRLPPAELRPFFRLRKKNPSFDVELRAWLTDQFGEPAAQAIAGATGALTFDYDPGRLSAAFVVERIQRILLSVVPTARYVVGGWGSLTERVGAHARAVGVHIETRARVEPADLRDLGPTIVAIEPRAARRLLGDTALAAESPQVALVDIGLEHRHSDPYLIVDLDEAAFLTRVTAVVPQLAPKGHDLAQISLGMRPGETLASAEARIEALLDAALPAWRDRLAWRRRAAVAESTGAVDLPGHTWHDRPPIDYRERVWLAGDWVAAPGHLSEVSCTSAVAAAHQAVAAAQRSSALGSPVTGGLTVGAWPRPF